jgi:hypothetical protein
MQKWLGAFLHIQRPKASKRTLSVKNRIKPSVKNHQMPFKYVEEKL